MSQMAASTAIVDNLICFSNLLGIKALRQDQKRFDTLAAENVLARLGARWTVKNTRANGTPERLRDGIDAVYSFVLMLCTDGSQCLFKIICFWY